MNAAGKGEIVINWVGGPEVFPAREQAEALRSGMVDMTIAPVNFTVSAFKFPEADALSDSIYNPVEERKNGVFDLIFDLHKKHGIYYLGRHDWHGEFYMWTTFPVTKMDDLKNHKMFLPVGWQAFYKELGAVGVMMEPIEVYTAMERGTIDGATQPLTSIRGVGLQELVKYCIDIPLNGSVQVVLVNQDKWNKLPKHLQDLVAKTYEKWEREWMFPYYEKLYASERKAIEDKGVKFIKFANSEENKKFHQIKEETFWKDTASRVGKESADKIRKITGR
jgi:TRAP-type C4-dicarboxylate transport system substrate-binding protein